MEDYCNYQLSMLLKEKGFNEPCEADYFGPDSTSVSIGIPKYNEYLVNGRCCAPSLAQAMKWLRDEKGIYISLRPRIVEGRVIIRAEVEHMSKYGSFVTSISIERKSYNDACEEAIKYSATDLI